MVRTEGSCVEGGVVLVVEVTGFVTVGIYVLLRIR